MAGTVKEEAVKLRQNLDKVYKAGQKSEYDRFWDAFQENGNRTNHTYAFCGTGWTQETFRPKYPVKPVGSAAYMFRYLLIADLKAHCEQYGIVIDTSKATNVDTLFQQSIVETFGDLDTRGCNSVIGALYQATTMRTIRIILRDDGSQTFQRNFTNANNLENLDIVGVIGQNGIDLHWSTELTHDSLMSVINALEDYSEDTTGTIWTLIIGSTNCAKLSEDDLEIAYNKGWMVQ